MTGPTEVGLAERYHLDNIMVIYKRITTQSTEYAKEKELRNEVLRIPLGLILSPKDTEEENNQIHIVATEKDKIIGCVLIVIEEDKARIRQMAVKETHRNQGVGKKLLIMAEQLVKQRKILHVCMNARVEAIGFYRKLGYEVASEQFIDVTIPHLKMTKTVNNHSEVT